MNLFSYRLKKLRTEKRLTQKKLAFELGYSRSTIANYENAIRIPSADVLYNIAEYFGVTTDYLLGRSNTKGFGKMGFPGNIANFNNLSFSLINTLSQVNTIRVPYKKYHAKNVSELAYEIGKKLALPASKLNALKIAGLLHDIGELYIPGYILNKDNNMLTENECNFIKEHPEYGYQLIKNIPFKEPISKIILQHHERLDGSGYPAALINNNILIEAKILGVADVIEALTSDQPYRKAYSINQALNILYKNKSKYDEKVIAICIKIFKDDSFNFTNKFKIID